MTDKGPRRQALPALLLVKTALQLLWQQRDDALRLGLVPTLLLFGGFLYGGEALVAMLLRMQGGVPAEPPPGTLGPILILGLAVLVAACLLTVNWLRFLLLGPMGAVGIGLSIGSAHFRFLFTAIGFTLGMMVAGTVLSLPLIFLPPALLFVGNLVVFAAVMVLTARFLPYLVGRAIGQSMTLAQTWSVTRGNGLPLAVSLILVQVPFLIVFAVVEGALGVVGFTRMAPIGTMFIFSVMQVMVWLAVAGILATAYRHMVGVRV